MSSGIQTVVVVFECVLALAGLAYIGWLIFSQAGRAIRARPAVLPAWDVSPTDFVFLGWLVFSIGIVGQLFVQFAIGPFLRHQPEGDTLQRLLQGSMFHFAALATWLGARAWVRLHPPEAFHSCAPAAQGCFLQSFRGGMLAFLALMPLAAAAGFLWEFLLQTLGLPTERQEIVDLILQSRSPALLGFLVVLALVLAPIAEELVFRMGVFRYLRSRPPIAVVAGAAVAGALLFLVGNGLILLVKGSTANAAGQFVLAAEIGFVALLLTILRGVRRFLFRPTPRWVAFAGSAGLFALLHGNWMSALPLFLLGLVFAASYERTGRIAVPMFAHALFNLNTLLLVLSGVGN